ncbi:MAG: ABC transporter ATP-binding protein [Solirubrobacteraceae bacterium]
MAGPSRSSGSRSPRPRRPDIATQEQRGEALLEVRELRTHFSLRGSFLDRVRGREVASVKAVDGVSLTLRRGEVLGIVGESGSGKTTLGRTLMGLIEASSGSVLFDGRDITHLGEKRLRPVRRRLQIVFQDPHASLNPAMTIAASVGHPLTIHGVVSDEDEFGARVAEALERVGLAPAQQFMDKYPGDLSGGQKQRAALARAIILDPDVLIADEPVSMLDMSVRAKILELMGELKQQLDLTYLYITHDLATAKYFCDRIAIMYLGRIVEIGPAHDIYDDPKHPYTAALLRAIPEPDPRRSVPRDLPRGEVPDAVNPPLGCPFHPRCPSAFEVCGWESRDLRALVEERWTRLPEEQFEGERAILGELDSLDAPVTEARLEAAPGHGGDEALEIVERLRQDRPDDPFWRGVAEVRAEPAAVVVRFHEGIVPREVSAAMSRVRCHLHDPEPLARARELSGAEAGSG